MAKNLRAMQEALGLIPGLGRFPEEENGCVGSMQTLSHFTQET